MLQALVFGCSHPFKQHFFLSLPFPPDLQFDGDISFVEVHRVQNVCYNQPVDCLFSCRAAKFRNHILVLLRDTPSASLPFSSLHFCHLVFLWTTRPVIYYFHSVPGLPGPFLLGCFDTRVPPFSSGFFCPSPLLPPGSFFFRGNFSSSPQGPSPLASPPALPVCGQTLVVFLQ